MWLVPYAMLPLLTPPEILEQKLVAPRREMQNLAMESDRLAASHAACGGRGDVEAPCGRDERAGSLITWVWQTLCYVGAGQCGRTAKSNALPRVFVFH
jgi:hypothetical protein